MIIGRKGGRMGSIFRPKHSHCVGTILPTQMFSPSKATGIGALPTGKVAQDCSIARPKLRHGVVGGIGYPDVRSVKGNSIGPLPTEKVPRLAPSLARSFVTVLLIPLATQMLAPSKATPCGSLPTGNEFPAVLRTIPAEKGDLHGVLPRSLKSPSR